MPETMARIVPLLNLGLKTTLTGHSLGSQRAAEAGAIFLDQYQPDPSMLRIIGMAGPAPGFQAFLDFLSKVEWRNYRNAAGFYGDPVPMLPLPLPPAFAYKNIPLTHVTKAPDGFLDLKDIDPIAWHSSALYAQAINAVAP
jgi:hypothetical protein